MSTAAVFDLGREAIFVLLKVGLPLMLVALVSGLIVSLFQALTQIQELTLTFVPKIIAMMLTALLAMPFMLETLLNFGQSLFREIGRLP